MGERYEVLLGAVTGRADLGWEGTVWRESCGNVGNLQRD